MRLSGQSLFYLWLHFLHISNWHQKSELKGFWISSIFLRPATSQSEHWHNTISHSAFFAFFFLIIFPYLAPCQPMLSIVNIHIYLGLSIYKSISPCVRSIKKHSWIHWTNLSFFLQIQLTPPHHLIIIFITRQGIIFKLFTNIHPTYIILLRCLRKKTKGIILFCPIFVYELDV